MEEWYAPENQDIRNYKNLQAFVIYKKDYKPLFGRGHSYLTLAKLKAREGDFSAAQNLFSQWETIREDLMAELEAENLLLDIIDIPRTIFTSARTVLFEQKKDRVLLEIVYGLCAHDRCDEAPQYIERLRRSGTRNAAWTLLALRMKDQGKIEEARLYAKNIIRSPEGTSMTDSSDEIKDRGNIKTLFSLRAELFNALSMGDEAQYYRALSSVY